MAITKLTDLMILSLSCLLISVTCVESQPTPSNPANITVYAIRPLGLIGLDNKDSADVAGDVFFWIKDRILLPMRCRVKPNLLCNTTGLLLDNQVYAKFTVEYDSTKLGTYASCNPNPSDPTGKTWECNCHSQNQSACGGIGVEDLSHYTHSGGQFPGDIYTPLLANKVKPGNWYSTESTGECGNPKANGACDWRVVNTSKIVNATCLNTNLVEAVVDSAGNALDKCGTCHFVNATLTSLDDCCIKGFFAGVAAMERDELLAPFEAAFSSTLPIAGGCAAIKPPAQ